MIKMKDSIEQIKTKLQSANDETKREYNKAKKDEYKKLYGVLKEIPKVGALNANHLLGLMALCGIIPPVLFEEEEGGAKKAYENLDEIYSLREKLITPNEVKKTLGNACKELFGKKPIDRKIENVLCKIGRRMKTNSDRLYVDLVNEDFPLVRYEDGRVTFETKKGKVFGSNKGMIGIISKLKKYCHSFDDKWMDKLK